MEKEKGRKRDFLVKIVMVVILMFIIVYLGYDKQNYMFNEKPVQNPLIDEEIKEGMKIRNTTEVVGVITEVNRSLYELEQKIYITIKPNYKYKNLGEIIKVRIDKDTEIINEYDVDSLQIGQEIKMLYKESTISTDINYEASNVVRLEAMGIKRIFTENDNKVSNSEAVAGSYVFGSFDISEDESIEFLDMTKQGNLYVKKIDNYEEYLIYKDKWKNIRELEEEDFLSYYLVLAVTEEMVDYKYSFRKSENNIKEDGMKILIGISQQNNLIIYRNGKAKEKRHTGMAIIVPNKDESYLPNDLRVIDESTLDNIKITEKRAKQIGEKALKEDGVKGNIIKIERTIENKHYLEKWTDTNIDYENKYKPVDKYDFVRTWHIVAEETDAPGCSVSIWIDVLTGDVLCYHWSGE